jgi:hypothetical protein
VSIPTYARLKNLQNSALQLDLVMRQMVEKMGMEKLEESSRK